MKLKCDSSGMLTIVSSSLYEESVFKLTIKELCVHLNGEIDSTLGMVLKNLVQRFGKIISPGPVGVFQYKFPDWKDLINIFISV